jgi:hypothetical protein
VTGTNVTNLKLKVNNIKGFLFLKDTPPPLSFKRGIRLACVLEIGSDLEI